MSVETENWTDGDRESTGKRSTGQRMRRIRDERKRLEECKLFDDLY